MKDDQTTGAASDPQTKTSSNKNPNKISADLEHIHKISRYRQIT